MAKQRLYTDQQIDLLGKMEAACADVDGYVQSLKALGLDMEEKELYNAQRKAMCVRCREVMQADKEE